MIYTDINALVDAMYLCDVDDADSVDMFRHLVAVYFDALHNPPEFVIGVGAISYAQEMLFKAQLDNV
jgi:hypothetical protein